MQRSATFQQRIHAFLAANPDEAILRFIFRSVVTVTILVLAADLAGMNGWIGTTDSAAEVTHDTPSLGLPDIVPSILAPLTPDGDKRLTPRPQADGVMAQPMTFELVGGGKLMATGTIMPGISEAFAAEVAKRGDYIKTVVLNSPGGSVADALAMGRLIRDKNFATEIEPGKYCASSCPLVFAGGVERRVGDKAIIGVHQVAAIGQAGGLPRDEMNVAQSISARCQRYLGDMGVSLQVWVHAMATTTAAVPSATAPRPAPAKVRS
ncbi:hypothetical protein [Bradyrhizobium valentinum]|uniref:Periplasmic protein n=1 Tax=Bradyrhizobium valentinum TaxID=1518501 RepID=A0A0R3KJR1_9BRAD|nr:hypothetical protein [Bradyrhizobium valentinum]KRQ95883.1 hypothetical protein CP49_28045 [Bradyrhizobium valentinum]